VSFNVLITSRVDKFNYCEWPWKQMEVGDLVEIEDMTPKSILRGMIRKHSQRTWQRFKTKTINGNLHVWRIA
jgi:hypothetical protein